MSSLQPPQSRIITDAPFDQLHVRYQQRFDCLTKALQISSRTTAPNLVRYPSIFCQESPMVLSISPMVAQINVRDASPVPKQTRFALALFPRSGLGGGARDLCGAHQPFQLAARWEMLPSRPSLNVQWLTPSLQQAGRRVKVLGITNSLRKTSLLSNHAFRVLLKLTGSRDTRC